MGHNGLIRGHNENNKENTCWPGIHGFNGSILDQSDNNQVGLPTCENILQKQIDRILVILAIFTITLVILCKNFTHFRQNYWKIHVADKKGSYCKKILKFHNIWQPWWGQSTRGSNVTTNLRQGHMQVMDCNGPKWLIYPYLSGLFHWHWGNYKITQAPGK